MNSRSCCPEMLLRFRLCLVDMICATQVHVFPSVADGMHIGGTCLCQQSFVYPHVFIGILLYLHSVEADIRQPMKPNGKDIGIWFSSLLVVDRDYMISLLYIVSFRKSFRMVWF